VADPVDWRADGTPFSPRFQHPDRSEDGALAEARDVFLAGCGLPAAWRGARSWCILETGFGPGLNFLVTWQAWQDDPQRPALLHYVATEAFPATAEALHRNAAADPALHALSDALADACYGLETGTHRISLDGGRVLLTLLIGDSNQSLRNLGRWADSVYLDGSSLETDPDKRDGNAVRAVARCCRAGARLATRTAARSVHEALASAGFAVSEGLAPKGRHLLAQLVHLPARHRPAPTPVVGDCTVIGAGLAGAAVARALALRGWRVTVLEAGPAPASGASGVPAGLFAPHISADDAVLSRITRAGVRALIALAQQVLTRGVDWDLSGVRQLRDGADPLLHSHAGWLRPARLVEALLATPGVQVHYGRPVKRIHADDRTLTVVATGHAAGELLGHGLVLQPVAGQVSFAPLAGSSATDMPWNGHGHFLPAVPDGEDGVFWLTGASFERDCAVVDATPADRLAHHQTNRHRLGELLPTLQPLLPGMFADVSDWRGVRGTSPDRLPIVGPWPNPDSTVWACTALGARGITTAVLCADILVASLHGEPLPVAPRLAESVGTARMARRIAKNA